MDPILTKQLLQRQKKSAAAATGEQDIEMMQQQPSGLGLAGDAGEDLTAVGLLSDMYYTQRSLDPTNVSLQSSFICMLHLANEKGLKFEQEAVPENGASLD